MLTSLRIAILSMMWALVMIAFALYFVLAPGEGEATLPPLVWMAGQVVVALALHGVIEAVGYRVPAIEPGTDRQAAGTRSGAAFTSSTFLRAALAESLAIASVAGAFLVPEGGFVLYVVGAVLALLLMGLHAWPGERPVRRTQAALERDGAASYLREQLGLAPMLPPGTIKEL